MKTIGNLAKYERVNSCESLEDIQNCILSFADEHGMIQGRTKAFEAKVMARGAEHFYKNLAPPNVLTREFGIRQQMMYIKHYFPYNKSLHG